MDGLHAIEVFLAVLVVGLLLCVFMVLPLLRLGTDRQPDIENTKESFPWNGRFAASAAVTISTGKDPAAIATNALQALGCVDLETVGESLIVGWIGQWGILNHGQRELGISWNTDRQENVTFKCSCRPRYQREFLDLGLSKRRMCQLARLVSSSGNRLMAP